MIFLHSLILPASCVSVKRNNGILHHTKKAFYLFLPHEGNVPEVSVVSKGVKVCLRSEEPENFHTAVPYRELFQPTTQGGVQAFCVQPLLTSLSTFTNLSPTDGHKQPNILGQSSPVYTNFPYRFVVLLVQLCQYGYICIAAVMVEQV